MFSVQKKITSIEATLANVQKREGFPEVCGLLLRKRAINHQTIWYNALAVGAVPLEAMIEKC